MTDEQIIRQWAYEKAQGYTLASGQTTTHRHRIGWADDIARWVISGDKQLASVQAPKTATHYCSFCAKSQHEVRKLIAGPATFICDECVAAYTDIIAPPNEQETTREEVSSP